MADQFTLYFYPMSYYSQKALLALYEKGVDFSSVMIDIHGGENTQPWYLKINPMCKVPALKHGDKIVTESEKIIDYVDEVVQTGPRFVPDGCESEVETFRRLLDDIPIEYITYGVGANQELSTTGIHASAYVKRAFTKEVLIQIMEAVRKESAENAISQPELSEYWTNRKIIAEKKIDFVLKPAKVAGLLDDLEVTFDKLEHRLQLSKEAFGSCSDTFWLVGKTYTAADLTATTMFLRLLMLGLFDRYTTSKRRPFCFGYAQRLLNRPSTKKVQALAKYVPLVYLKTRIRKTLPAVAKVGTIAVLVGAAAYLCRKYDVLDNVKGFFK